VVQFLEASRVSCYSETAPLIFETLLSPSQRFIGGWGVDLTAYCNQRRVWKWMGHHLWFPIRLNVVLCGNVKPWLQSKLVYALTLYLLMLRIWWAPNNASKGQMRFNLAFKGLINFPMSSNLFIMFYYVQNVYCVMEMTVNWLVTLQLQFNKEHVADSY